MKSIKLLSSCCITALLLLLGIWVEFAQGNEHTKPELEVEEVGERLILQCPVLLSASVRWLKNNQTLNLKTQQHIKLRIRTKKLKILGLKLKDSGNYSCDTQVNGTWRRVKTWQINVTREITVAPPPVNRPPDPACGEPVPEDVIPHCPYETNLTHCKSFPGKPRDVKIITLLHRNLPAIQVQWKAPLTGFGDLQGYAVLLLGYRNHVNQQQCFQINSILAPEFDYITFHTSANDPEVINVLFGAQYKVTLTSLPSHKDKNKFSKVVNIPEKCAWKKFKDLPECYAVSNLTATVERVNEDVGWKINVTWDWHLKHNNSISKYEVYGTTHPHVLAFYSETTVNGNQSRTSIIVPPTTRCINLTITVLGKTAGGTNTKEARIKLPNVGDCPTPIPPVKVVVPKTDDRTLKIAVIVGSVLFSIMLVVVFHVLYRYYYKPVVLKLPAATPSNGDPSDPMLDGEQQKRRVYIMHSYCCEKCNWAVIQFGDLLRSTELIDVGLDLWDTLEMLPNKPLYYEKQIRESDCVVVMADSTMKECALSPKTQEKCFDGKYARFQLDLIRGEITTKPDTRKYVPVYMSFNSTKKDIPDFLSSRLSHALPEEINRVVFHLLNIERIQPRRRRMIAVIGGNDHPYDEAKKRFEAAIDSAERYHWELQQSNNDGRIELLVPTVRT